MDKLRPSPAGMTRGFGGMLSWALLSIDVASVTALLAYFSIERTGQFSTPYQYLAGISAALMVIVYRTGGVFHRMRLGGWRIEAVMLLRAWIVTLMLLVTLLFLTKTTDMFSREAMLKWASAGYAVQFAIHVAIRAILRQLRASGVNVRYAVVIGRGAMATRFVELIRRNRWIGAEVVGMIDFDDVSRDLGEDSSEYESEVVERAWQGVDRLMRSRAVDTIYFAVSAGDVRWMELLAERLAGETVEINWVPDISSFVLLNSSVRELEGQPIICLSDSPLTGGRVLIKRIEDIVLGGFFLALAIPIMILIGAAILVTSGRPILFRQKRGGLYGKPIEVWKFRTMHVHHEQPGKISQARPGDARITPIGAFLRRTSLDELPQLLHVATGSMSLVGPRPHALEHDTYYGELIDRYLLRYKIKPGLTGWAQVNGFRGETAEVEKMEMRVAYDLYYIRNWSVSLDLLVIWKTLWQVLADSNAY